MLKGAYWVLSCFLTMAASSGQNCHIEIATVSSTGQQANGTSSSPSLSNDGRLVGFGSSANNLVPGDSNGWPDCFVRDRVSGSVELVSVSTAGIQGNARSVGPKLSDDGRLVAFSSEATNLDPRDTDSVLDVYVHDRLSQTTTLVSERLGVGQSVQGCYGVAISADGRYVAFDCIDDNVLPGDNNFSTDVFVRDLQTQTTTLVSVGPLGQPGDRESLRPSISGDGQFVSFVSASRNWYPIGPAHDSGIFVRDCLQGITHAATLLPSGYLNSAMCWESSISSDGRYVAYMGGGPRLVGGLPYTLFGSDVLRWDRLTGDTINLCISTTGGAASTESRSPSLSADGRFVTFQSVASNLTVQRGIPPVVIWKDIQTGATVIVNEDPQGGPANNIGNDAAISEDGRVVAFVSRATDLVPGVSGNVYHVYVRSCDVASPSIYCKPAKLTGGCIASMTFQGVPSATATSGFLIQANSLDAKKVSLVFYGTTGPWGQQLPDGFLCVKAPIVRPYVAWSGGGTGCAGSLSFDFNAWIASGGDPVLVSGQAVCAQAWFRNAAGAGQLSDALAFLIGP